MLFALILSTVSAFADTETWIFVQNPEAVIRQERGTVAAAVVSAFGSPETTVLKRAQATVRDAFVDAGLTVKYLGIEELPVGRPQKCWYLDPKIGKISTFSPSTGSYTGLRVVTTGAVAWLATWSGETAKQTLGSFHEKNVDAVVCSPR